MFIDEFVVHNRLLTGGMVIDGRALSLADIRCPILCFVGTRDDIARPASVRAIGTAAPLAELFEIAISAGHFGLVVGSTAMRESWPAVVEWLNWRDGAGPRPRRIEPDTDAAELEIEDAAFAVPLDVALFYDVLLGTLRTGWKRVGDAVENMAEAVDALRYQVPRLRRLRRMHDETRISFAGALAEQYRPAKTLLRARGLVAGAAAYLRETQAGTVSFRLRS
jgi:putative long chain acyl-CoA synthase